MSRFLIGFITNFLVHLYALVTLMMAWGDEPGMFMSILTFVLIVGAIASASVCGSCISQYVDIFDFKIIGILIILYLLPICAGILSNVLPSWLYMVMKMIYIVVFALVGIAPSLAGGLVYLMTALSSWSTETRIMVALIPALVCGFFFGGWLMNKYASRGSSGYATVYDEDGNRSDIYFY